MRAVVNSLTYMIIIKMSNLTLEDVVVLLGPLYCLVGRLFAAFLR